MDNSTFISYQNTYIYKRLLSLGISETNILITEDFYNTDTIDNNLNWIITNKSIVSQPYHKLSDNSKSRYLYYISPAILTNLEKESILFGNVGTSTKTVPDNMFKDCINLLFIKITNSVINIGSTIFENCVNLTEINVPNSVITIANDAFSGCTNVMSLSLSNTVLSFGNNNLTSILAKSGSVRITILDNSTVISYQNTYIYKRLLSLGISETNILITEDFYDTSKINNTSSWIITNQPLKNITYHKLSSSLKSRYLYYITPLGIDSSEKSSVLFVNINPTLVSVSNNLFLNCNNIISVIIPNGVTSINSSAFQGCSSLISVIIPNSVTSINSSAFQGCSSLISVNMSNSLISISNNLFKDCSNLTSIDIPNSVTSIDSSAFQGCSSLISVNMSNGLINISNNVFKDCYNLTSINIPNSVINIDDGVFSGCNNLTLMQLTNTIISFGINNLTSILEKSGIVQLKMLDNVEYTNTYIYKTLITYLSYSNITIVDDFYDKGTISTTSNWLITNTPLVGKSYDLLYTDIPRSRYFYYNSPSTIVNNIENTYIFFANIEPTVKSISNYAFNNCRNLFFINIPSNVTKIGSYAFANCFTIKSFNLPNNITSIGSNVFNNCKSLEYLNIPNGVATISSYIFQNCSNLTAITIPSSVTYIDTYAFQNCTSLQSVDIPDSITSLGTYVFQNCSNLTSVNMSTNIIIIPDNAFNNCNNIVSLSLSNSILSIATGNFTGLANASAQITITIIDYFNYLDTYIYNYFIANNVSPSKITIINNSNTSTINNNLDWIVTNAPIVNMSYNVDNSDVSRSRYFYYVSPSAISGINLGGIVLMINIAPSPKYTRIPDYAFSGYIYLQSINIPSTVTSIGNNAFEGCFKLVSISIPNSVLFIGGRAFAYCGLLSINIPNGITEFSGRLFTDCYSLKSIIIPSSVRTINDYAFANCVSLTSLTLSNTTTTIANTHYNCPLFKIGSITINMIDDIPYETIPLYKQLLSYGVSASNIIINNDFYDTSKINNNLNWFVTYTPVVGKTYDASSDTSRSRYIYYNSVSMVGTNSTDRFNILFANISPNTTSIPVLLFYNCRSLYSVTFPDTITSIGHSAFAGCSSLLFIPIPPKITIIDINVFRGCELISHISIPKGVTSIEQDAFNGCLSLTSVNIPDTVKIIKGAFNNCGFVSFVVPQGVSDIAGTFYNCTKLKSVTLPSSVTGVADLTFNNCYSLTELKLTSSINTLGISQNTPIFRRDSISSITITLIDKTINIQDTTVYKRLISLGVSTSNIIINNDFYDTSTIDNNLNWIITNTPLTSKSYDVLSDISKSRYLYYILPTSFDYNGPERFYILFANLGSTTKTIAPMMFYNCRYLQSINIPNIVTTISARAFSGCSRLNTITMPKNLTVIDTYAFEGCSSLTAIKIPNAVISIGNGAFEGCSSISSINIPNNVTAISTVFNGCNNLVSLALTTNIITFGERNIPYSLLAPNSRIILKWLDTSIDYKSSYIYKYLLSKSISENNIIIAPKMSGFSITSKLYGDAPFVLKDPVSTSQGAFSYISFDTDIATVSGNIVTIVGIGSTIIQAIQEPYGFYEESSIDATLTVNDPTSVSGPVVSAAAMNYFLTTSTEPVASISESIKTDNLQTTNDTKSIVTTSLPGEPSVSITSSTQY